MAKWFFAQLTQVSAWIGLAVVISAVLLPREYIAILGVVLILVDDDILKNLMNKYAPSLAKKIEEWTK